MASSGRQSRPERRVYAFGSCTPRTMTYLDNIPKAYRVYNAKVRRNHRSTGPTLSDYMREARQDGSPVRRRDRSLDSSLHNKWAFGSSTPRELSYLKQIKPEYRVYDVKLEAMIDDERRSQTTTFVPSHSGGVKRYIRRSSSMSLLSGGEGGQRKARASRPRPQPKSKTPAPAADDSAKKRQPPARTEPPKARATTKTVRTVPQPVKSPPPAPAKSPSPQPATPVDEVVAPPESPKQQASPPESPKPEESAEEPIEDEEQAHAVDVQLMQSEQRDLPAAQAPATAVTPPPPAESPNEDLDDEVASEPDFVQDRYMDFARQTADESTVARATADQEERIPSDDEQTQQEEEDNYDRADHDNVQQHHEDNAHSTPHSPNADNHHEEGAVEHNAQFEHEDNDADERVASRHNAEMHSSVIHDDQEDDARDVHMGSDRSEHVDHHPSPPKSPHDHHAQEHHDDKSDNQSRGDDEVEHEEHDEGKSHEGSRQSRSSSIKSGASSRNEPVHVHDYARTVEDVGEVQAEAAFHAEQPFEHEEREPAESPSLKERHSGYDDNDEHDVVHVEHPSSDRMSPMEAAGAIEPEWERRMQADMLSHQDQSGGDEDDGSTAAEPSAIAQHHSELKGGAEHEEHEEHEERESYTSEHHAQLADDSSDQLGESFDQRAHQLESPIGQPDHEDHNSPDHQARFSDSPEHKVRTEEHEVHTDEHEVHTNEHENSGVHHQERFAESPDHHDNSSPPPQDTGYHHGEDADNHRFDADSPVQHAPADESHFTAVEYRPEQQAGRKDSSSSSSSSSNGSSRHSRKSSASAQKITHAGVEHDGEHHPVGNGAARHTDANDANGNESDTF